MVVNNPEIMGVKHVNGLFSNIFMIIVTWVTLVLGIVNVTKSVVSLMEDVQVSPDVLFGSATALALVITVIITIHILLKRKREIQKMLQQSQQEK
jgi:uncharacterized membrane protein YidH (DUF202 family)